LEKKKKELEIRQPNLLHHHLNKKSSSHTVGVIIQESCPLLSYNKVGSMNNFHDESHVYTRKRVGAILDIPDDFSILHEL
jgi:hypothetical protein